MALSAYVGTFAQPTATGTAGVTGVGFQPKALLFWGNNQTASGTSSSTYEAMGMATGTVSEGYFSNYSPNAVGSVTSRRNYSTTNCYGVSSTVGTAVAQADFVSFDSDGFLLNWNRADANARVVNFLALGGDDLTNANVIGITSATIASTVSYTGVGFQPDFLCFLTTVQTSASTTTFSVPSVGFSNGTGNITLTKSVPVEGGGPVGGKLSNNRSVITTSGTANFIEGSITSLNSDGFSISWNPTGTTGRLYSVLCLKGGQYVIGTAAQLTSNGTQDLTGFGFQPKAALLLGNNSQTINTNVSTSRFSFGGFSGTSIQASMWSGDGDTGVLSISNSNLETTHAISMFTEGTLGPALNSQADFVSFDSDGVSLNWTTTDATARLFGYVAFGDTPAGTQTGLKGLIMTNGFIPFYR